MKPWIKWALAVVVLALVATGVLRALSNRKAQQTALQTQTERQKVRAPIALQATDQWIAKTTELTQTLALSGSIKAVHSALVKARVAGELQGLQVREGDTVQSGTVLATIDPTEYKARLQQAQQQADSAKAQVDIAKRAFDNNQALVQQGFISSTALESSAATLAGTQATHRAAVAAADVARKAMDDTQLRAPLSGVVSQRLAQPGERVSVDARILEVVDVGNLELEAAITAAESAAVRVGQVAQIAVEGSNNLVTARVARINPSASAGSRAVQLYLSLDRATGLRHGMFAQGTLMLGRVQAVAVPLTSVRTDKPSPYVQVLANNQIVHIEVQLGARGEHNGQTLVAVTGLPENSVVLSGSVGALHAGTPVKPASAP